MAFSAIMSAVDGVVFDAKKQVVNDFMTFLETKIDFDDDMKGYFEEFLGSLKKPAATKKSKAAKKANALTASGASDKPEKPKRKPSAYNMFISAKMAEIKKADPSIKGKELMKAAIVVWNEQKAAAAASADVAKPEAVEEASESGSESD
jgi:hypothetical protein